MNPSISIILTVHNKEILINRVVSSILANVSELTRELIVIFDGCNDRSIEFFNEAIVKFEGKIDVNIVTIITDNIWETKANNIGLKKAIGDYSIIIQDDMVINEYFFDKRLLRPFQCYSDCFAVTGRLAHNDYVKRKGFFKKMLYFGEKIGRENPCGRDVFGIRDVVNRGPLMLDMNKVRALDYLDEAFAPLDLDDHDLCLRAWAKYKWVCGSYLIDYKSDLEWGTTRSNPKSREVLKKSHAKNQSLLIKRYENLLLMQKHDENRIVTEA